jgi:hypothetical protein
VCLMGLSYLYYIPRDMEELHPYNACEINVTSPLYVINDNKIVLLHDECGINILHKITTSSNITLRIITFQSNTFQHPPLIMTREKEDLWKKMELQYLPTLPLNGH